MIVWWAMRSITRGRRSRDGVPCSAAHRALTEMAISLKEARAVAFAAAIRFSASIGERPGYHTGIPGRS